MSYNLSEKMIQTFKRLPIDFGQGNMRHVTAGKRILLDLVQPGNGRTALELGCRDGFYSEILIKRGYTVFSVDIEKKYDKVILADINHKLPFKNMVFDLVWCSEVIEHLDEVEYAVNEFRRVTKPGGTILLTTPNSYFWVFKIASILGYPPSRLQRSDHQHFFSEQDIHKLFPNAQIFGFFPYFLFKFRIRRFISLLSPTFIIYEIHHE